MRSLVFLSVLSFAAALAMTALVRSLSLRLGLVDLPDGGRKLHRAPVPRTGGVAVALSCVIAYVILLLTPAAGGTLIRQGLPVVLQILPAVALVFLVGLIDDLKGLRPWVKLSGVAVAALLAISAGVRIGAVAGFRLDPWLGGALTVFWLLACANAFNLIDGVDGLAAGIGFFATVTIVIAAALHGNFPLALATVPLAGALLGFLVYNFNPACIFLGDSGSLVIGFMLGCCGVLWSHKSATLVGMTAPLMALAVPLVDTGLAILRRFLRRQPIFGADRGHIHHRLLARGFTPRRVVYILYLACGGFAVMSLLISLADQKHALLGLLLFVIWTVVGVERLGLIEFAAIGRMLRGAAFRQHLNEYVHLQDFESSLAAAASVQETWDAISRNYVDLGFSQVSLDVDGRTWSAGAAADPSSSWRLTVPLKNGSCLTLARPLAAGSTAPAIPESLRESLVRKLDELAAEPVVVRTRTPDILPLSRAIESASES